MSFMYTILPNNKIGIQSVYIGTGGNNEVKRVALRIKGIMSNDLLTNNTCMSVNTISAIASVKSTSISGY